MLKDCNEDCDTPIIIQFQTLATAAAFKKSVTSQTHHRFQQHSNFLGVGGWGITDALTCLAEANNQESEEKRYKEILELGFRYPW